MVRCLIEFHSEGQLSLSISHFLFSPGSVSPKACDKYNTNEMF